MLCFVFITHGSFHHARLLAPFFARPYAVAVILRTGPHDQPTKARRHKQSQHEEKDSERDEEEEEEAVKEDFFCGYTYLRVWRTIAAN